MELDKTKIYSLEGMDEQEVKDFFSNNDIVGLWLDFVFLSNDIAESNDLIEYKSNGWYWCFNWDYEGSEIIKVKDL